MKFLTKVEIQQLLANWRAAWAAKGDLPWHREIRTPETARGQIALVKWLLANLPSDAPILVHINDWDVWSENMALFDFLRSAWNEHRPLIESPGHLLDASEQLELECILDVILYFCWGATIFDERGRFVITLSSDGFVDVACEDALRPALDAVLEEFAEKGA